MSADNRIIEALEAYRNELSKGYLKEFAHQIVPEKHKPNQKNYKNANSYTDSNSVEYSVEQTNSRDNADSNILQGILIAIYLIGFIITAIYFLCIEFSWSSILQAIIWPIFFIKWTIPKLFLAIKWIVVDFIWKILIVTVLWEWIIVTVLWKFIIQIIIGGILSFIWGLVS